MNEFQELVKEVVDELKGWEYVPRTDDYNSCFEQIAAPYGATITLSSRWRLGDLSQARLNVYGKYPTHEGKPYHRSNTTPRITVAAKRGAKAIAKDIERRFLPKFLPLYAEATAWVQQKVEADDEDTASLTAIATALGVPAPKPASKQVKLQYARRGAWGHFEANYDGTFRVELRDVSLEVALAIAEVLEEV